MSKQKVTVFPSEFQIEPIDMGAFDVWQDWEGLQDASDECKRAWKSFVADWRVDRKKALVQQVADMSLSEGLSPADLTSVRRAKRIGAAFGLAKSKGALPQISEAEKTAYWRWRSRVLRSDPVAWAMFWAPDKPMTVASRYGRTEREVLAIRAIVARWLDAELGVSDANCGEVGVIIGGR